MIINSFSVMKFVSFNNNLLKYAHISLPQAFVGILKKLSAQGTNKMKVSYGSSVMYIQ